MTILFYVLVVWTILYVISNIVSFGWGHEMDLSGNDNVKKIANLINLVYLSLLLLYLFNSFPK